MNALPGEPAVVEPGGAESGNLCARMWQPAMPTESAGCDVYLATLSSLRRQHFQLLDRVEVAREHRYLRQNDRDRFVLGVVLLRAIAAQELRIHPQELVVDRTCGRCGEPHGRPRLVGTQLEASVSHSGELVAVAVTWAGPVGIDIEEMRPLDYRPLVADVCNKDEQTYAVGQPEFYTYWTRKEAFLKATGEGLSRPIQDVVVTAPGSPPAVLSVGHKHAPPSQMFDVRAGANYAGAAVVLTSRLLRCRTRDGTGLLAATAAVTKSPANVQEARHSAGCHRDLSTRYR
jgi:4'-phosphopantetheinyl transferase